MFIFLFVNRHRRNHDSSLVKVESSSAFFRMNSVSDVPSVYTGRSLNIVKRREKLLKELAE